MEDDEVAYDVHTIVGMGDINTVEIAPGSEVTLRYTVSQDCRIRWKFKSEGGNLVFGVKKKKAVKNKEGGGFMEDSSKAAVEVFHTKQVVQIHLLLE